jgi:hypothetical protein
MLNDIIAASNVDASPIGPVRRLHGIQARRNVGPKEKWAFAHSFLRVTPQCAKGEAKGQIRLLFKNTPFSGELQRFPAGRQKAAFPAGESISPVGYRINSSGLIVARWAWFASKNDSSSPEL